MPADDAVTAGSRKVRHKEGSPGESAPPRKRTRVVNLLEAYGLGASGQQGGWGSVSGYPSAHELAMAGLVPSWDSVFEDLLERRIITGYGLIIAGSLDITAGEMSELLEGPTHPAQQFARFFRGVNDYPISVQLPGKRPLPVIRKTDTDAYALGRGGLLGLCINNLPFGILVSSFRRPILAHQVIPLMEKCCHDLRR